MFASSKIANGPRKAQSHTIGIIQFVLPEAQDTPTRPSEDPIDGTIPHLVPRQFYGPKLTVRARRLAVEGAAMPKASIHENCQTVAREDEVGAADKGATPAPSRDAELSKNLNEFQFGSPIASAPDVRHDLGSLRLGEDIGHWMLTALTLRGRAALALKVSINRARVTPHKRRRQRVTYHLRGGELSSAE